MTTGAEIKQVRGELRRLGKPEKYQAIRHYFNNTSLKMYGVSVPVLRKIAKRLATKLKKDSSSQILTLTRSLYQADSFEERQLASYFLTNCPQAIETLSTKDFDFFIKQVDNWAVSDALSHVLGRWFLKKPKQATSYLGRLVKDRNLWARRQALVVSFYINFYQNQVDYSHLPLKFVEETKQEKHPMIVKAISWALRGLAKHQPKKLEKYLKSKGDSLPALARREAIKKLKTGKKN